MMIGRLRAILADADHQVTHRDDVPEAAVAWLLGVSLGTLRNMRTQKRAPPFRKLPCGVFFPIEDLAIWLDETIDRSGANRFTHLHASSRIPEVGV